MERGFTSFSVFYTTNTQNVNKDVEYLNDTISRIDLIDIILYYRNTSKISTIHYFQVFIDQSPR